MIEDDIQKLKEDVADIKRETSESRVPFYLSTALVCWKGKDGWQEEEFNLCLLPRIGDEIKLTVDDRKGQRLGIVLRVAKIEWVIEEKTYRTHSFLEPIITAEVIKESVINGN